MHAEGEEWGGSFVVAVEELGVNGLWTTIKEVSAWRGSRRPWFWDRPRAAPVHALLHALLLVLRWRCLLLPARGRADRRPTTPPLAAAAGDAHAAAGANAVQQVWQAHAGRQAAADVRPPLGQGAPRAAPGRAGAPLGWQWQGDSCIGPAAAAWPHRMTGQVPAPRGRQACGCRAAWHPPLAPTAARPEAGPPPLPHPTPCRSYVLSSDKRLQRLRPFSHSPVTWFRNPYVHVILVRGEEVQGHAGRELRGHRRGSAAASRNAAAALAASEERSVRSAAGGVYYGAAAPAQARPARLRVLARRLTACQVSVGDPTEYKSTTRAQIKKVTGAQTPWGGRMLASGGIPGHQGGARGSQACACGGVRRRHFIWVIAPRWSFRGASCRAEGRRVRRHCSRKGGRWPLRLHAASGQPPFGNSRAAGRPSA
jgi:hypothetical protein